jgi:hypothetical protein
VQEHATDEGERVTVDATLAPGQVVRRLLLVATAHCFKVFEDLVDLGVISTATARWTKSLHQ